MKKTAVVYDKWLSSLGGGEVVACTIAKILHEKGYLVTFVCGKEVSAEVIKKNFGIDLSRVEFVEIWNDEVKLKSLVLGKDLFVNTSFMDYSIGMAQKNLYYTHFPTKPYDSTFEKWISKFILYFLAKTIKPTEFITQVNAPLIFNRKPAYRLEKTNKMAFSYLNVGEKYIFEFSIYLESFSVSLLNKFRWSFDNALVLEKTIDVDHYNNTINFKIKVQPNASTIYLNLSYEDQAVSTTGKIYLFYPKVLMRNIATPWVKHLTEKFNNRLRAGIFVDITSRIDSYQSIIANSNYTKKWIRNYWGKDATVIFPPVELLFKKHILGKRPKKKIICSVGRFFTLGHGKKQEVLVEAFKVLYDKGYQDWQLHLAGGLGTEPSSLEFTNKLKSLAGNYPIFFHFNVTRKTIEKLYQDTSIYWHAAGFGESELDYPVKFEHFGIAPIEAISARCIPILFRGGGLPEIIAKLNLDLQKHTFETINDLVKKTEQYMGKEAEDQIDWTNVNKQLDLNFSTKSFQEKLLKLI